VWWGVVGGGVGGMGVVGVGGGGGGGRGVRGGGGEWPGNEAMARFFLRKLLWL